MLTVAEATRELGPLIAERRLIAFVGSGISKFAGLPTWDQFLQEFVEFCSEYAEFAKEETKQLLTDAREGKNNPIQVATVLKDWLIDIDTHTDANVKANLQNWFSRLFLSAKPSIQHKLVVDVNFPFILTSNYDDLLERAAKERKYKGLSRRSYSFIEADRQKLAESVHLRHESIIHVHGKAEGIQLNEVVLTSEDYIQMIKRKHGGFTFIIQQLLFGYSTIFLGYGASDPHLEDLVEELAYFLQYPKSANLPKTYLVAKADKANQIFERYKRKMRTELIVINDWGEYTTLLQGLKSYGVRNTDSDDNQRSLF